MENNTDCCYFDQVSDDLLLHIFLYIPRRYWKNLKNVCTRFRNVCHDKEIFRVSNLSCAYGVSEQDLQDYLRAGSSLIFTLNLNHCQWFTSTALSTWVSRCKKIQNLYLLDCRLTTKGLSKILCSLECLRTLVISVTNLLELSNEVNSNPEVQFSLRNLKHFGLHIREESNINAPSLQFHLSQQTTIIEYCPQLESFCVIGQPGSSQKLSKRLIHPLIVKAENMSNLKTMSVNCTNDATSRLYFFGVLVRAFEAGVHFRNLSVSGLDLKQAVKKSYFIRSLKESCPTLENLDLSKVHIDELEASITIDDGPCLKYLNLSDIRSESRCIGLLNMASHCPNLVSLNLRGATSGHKHWTQEELESLSSLLQNCPSLQHVNLSGIHVHSEDQDLDLIHTLTKHRLKGLRSLALPVCCLVKTQRLSKHAHANYAVKGFGKRQRIARHPVASTSNADSSPGLVTDDNLLSELSLACPALTSLELINSGFNQSVVLSSKKSVYEPCALSYKVLDHHLASLKNFTQLRYLQVTGMPGVKMGGFLQELATSCPRLEVLCLAYMGLGTQIQQLWDRIQHFTHLRHLRIEQPNLRLDERFFHSLRHCPLERLVIVSKNSKIIDSVAAENFVKQVRSLYLLQLYTDSHIKDCEKLQSGLQKRFETERPGFLAIVDQLHHEKVPYVLASLPLQHLEELTLLSSKVCSKPLQSIWGQGHLI